MAPGNTRKKARADPKMKDRTRLVLPDRNPSDYSVNPNNYNSEFGCVISSLKMNVNKGSNGVKRLELPPEIKGLFLDLTHLCMLIRNKDLYENNNGILEVIAEEVLNWDDLSNHLMKWSCLAPFKITVLDIIGREKSRCRSGFMTNAFKPAAYWLDTDNGHQLIIDIITRDPAIEIINVPIHDSLSYYAAEQLTIEAIFGSVLSLVPYAEIYLQNGIMRAAADSVTVAYLIFQAYQILRHIVLAISEKAAGIYSQEEMAEFTVIKLFEAEGSMMSDYRSEKENKDFWKRLEKLCAKHQYHTRVNSTMMPHYDKKKKQRKTSVQTTVQVEEEEDLELAAMASPIGFTYHR